MNKKTTFTCGNYLVSFKLRDTLVFDDSLTELVNAGITQILQRKPASRWEKLAAGYEKRPDKFERNSIPFTQSLATLMHTCMSDTVKEWAMIEISEYVLEVKLGKYKEEVEAIARHESQDDVETWLADTIGFSEEYVDSTTESGYSIEALKAVNSFKREFLKKALA